MNKTLLIVIVMFLSLLLTGCGYGEIEGTIIDKDHDASTIIPQMIYTGKTWVTVPVTHPESWKIKLKKEESRRSENNLDKRIRTRI